jgi:hypothetical protein
MGDCMMKCNIGCAERNVRLIVGSVLVTLAITHNIGLWGWIGLIPLVTGVMKVCPVYGFLKKSTCCQNCNGGCGCK